MTGSVTGGSHSGGLVGDASYAYNDGSLTIANCYARGSVTGGSHSGGLVGYAYTSGSLTMHSCVALNPSVSGSGNVGRIAGHTSDTVTLTNTYALNTMSAGGATDGTDVSPENATSQSFYEYIGWDFANTWKMDASISRYPVLQWQGGSTPDAITECTNTTLTWNAETPAEIGYELVPASLANLTAPVFTHGNSTLRLTENIRAEKIVSGAAEEIAAIINPNRTISISDDISDAETLRISFIGRCLGDVNSDGKIRGSDAVLIARDVVGMLTLGEADAFYADINGDGKVQGTDAVAIARYAVGLNDADYNPVE